MAERFITFQVLLLLFMLQMVVPFSADAGELLDNINFSETDEVTDIRINFAIPFDYVKHFPSKRGKVIQIQIKPVDPSIDKRKIKRREIIEPDGSFPEFIRDVIYEGNVRGGPYLVIRFQKVMQFGLEKENNDGTSLLIHVKKVVDNVAKTNPSLSKATSADKRTGGNNKKADPMMDDGRNALTRGENTKAILLFSQLLEMSDHDHIANAKEYLGLARERSGQLDLAKKEYEEYIEIHPKSRRLNTVKQRLMTLNARIERQKKRPKAQLTQTKRATAAKKGRVANRNDLFGRVQQLYYSTWTEAEGKDSRQARSDLLTFFDITQRIKTQEHEARLVFSASNSLDFLGKLTQRNQIRSLFADYKGSKNHWVGKFGRQSANKGGVLGRFDGGFIGYKFKSNWQINGVLGTPVPFKSNSIEVSRPLAGVSLDVDELIENWKGSTYLIAQRVDGMTERLAVGGDVRYFNKKNRRTFFSLVDYDVSYNVLNFIRLHYGMVIKNNTKLDVQFGRTRTPIMLTSNALTGLASIRNVSSIGLPEDGTRNLDDIRDRLVRNPTIKQMLAEGATEEAIRERAKQNTGHSTLISASLNHQFHKELQLNANLTLSKYQPGNNLRADANADKLPPKDNLLDLTGFDSMLSAQLMMRNLWLTRDSYLIGMRFNNSERNQRFSSSFSARAPLNKQWNANARLNLSYIKNTEKNQASGKISPSFKAEYRLNRKMTFEASTSLDINRSNGPSEDFVWWQINIGYRYIF